VGKGSFTSLQSAISVLAGAVSITGAVYSAVEFVRPGTGEIRAVVRSEKGDRPLPGSTIEVLTPADAVVATLTAGDDGSVRHPVRQGAYRLRVSAARFGAQTREVQVEPGAAAEVRFRLALHEDDARLSATDRGSPLAHPVSRGVGAAGRFLHRLGL